MALQSAHPFRRPKRQRPRKTMDADFSKIEDAVAAGSVAVLKGNMSVTLRLTSNRSVRLVSADGVATPAGEHYYELRGERPPEICPYEQGLVNGKFLKGFDNHWHQMRRMLPDGTWAVTRKGADYFKHNQDEFSIEYPVRRAFMKKQSVDGKPVMAYFVEPFDGTYKRGDDGIFGGNESVTVGKLKAATHPQPRRPPLPELASRRTRSKMTTPGRPRRSGSGSGIRSRGIT